MARQHLGFTLKTIKSAAVIFSSLLFLSVCFGIFAPYHYIFDLFSHFKGQYLAGALILGIIHTLFRKWIYSGICVVIALFLLIDTRSLLHAPWQFFPPLNDSTFAVMSFNQFLFQEQHDLIEKWISDNSKNLDVVAIFEATDDTVAMAQNLRDIFPFQILNPQSGSTGQIILSKHPIKDQSFISFDTLPYSYSYAIEFSVQPPSMDTTTTFYSLHPPTPTSTKRWEHRNGELDILASQIKEKNSPVIVLGDFNNTPYTPSFRSFLHQTGLNYQSYGLLQQPTWPSQFLLPLFQIPIDHILYSDHFMQQNKYTKTFAGSDHKAVIAKFSQPQQ